MQMDTKDVRTVRVERLAELISDEYGGNQTAFARATGFTAPQINRWLSPTAPDGRALTEVSARKIEERAGKPSGWLDMPNDEYSEEESELRAIFRTISASDRALIMERARTIIKMRK